MPFFIAVLGVLSIVSIYKYIFRRILSSNNVYLKQKYSLNTNWKITIQDILSEEEKSLIKKSYCNKKDAGSQYIKWIVGLYNHPITTSNNDNTDTDDNTNDPILLSKYQIITYYMMECKIRFAQMYGFVLVQRDKKGKYLGSIGIIPPYPSWWLYKAHYQRAIVPIGKNIPLHMNDSIITKRYQSYSNIVNKQYKLMTIGVDIDDDSDNKKKNMKVPPPSPQCWQILFVSVIKRKKGYGKNLMNAAKLLIESHYQHETMKEKAKKEKQQKKRNANKKEVKPDTTPSTTTDVMDTETGSISTNMTANGNNNNEQIYPRIYIETDAVNVSFFHQMGFQINQSYPLTDDDTDNNTSNQNNDNNDNNDDSNNKYQHNPFLFHSMMYEYNDISLQHSHVTLNQQLEDDVVDGDIELQQQPLEEEQHQQSDNKEKEEHQQKSDDNDEEQQKQIELGITTEDIINKKKEKDKTKKGSKNILIAQNNNPNTTIDQPPEDVGDIELQQPLQQEYEQQQEQVNDKEGYKEEQIEKLTEHQDETKTEDVTYIKLQQPLQQEQLEDEQQSNDKEEEQQHQQKSDDNNHEEQQQEQIEEKEVTTTENKKKKKNKT